MNPTVHVRRETRAEGAVAFVTLDDERRLNCMGVALMEAFVRELTAQAQDDELCCVVLTGAGGRAFCGGADLDALAALTTPDAARAFIGRVHACCAAVRDLPVPVIARLNGYTLGAGLELAASCDLRVASDNAVFGMPEVKLGIPSVVEAALLPGLVGWGRANEMLLLGETFDAAAALVMGLVEAVVPAAELDAAVEGRIAALLTSAPRAVRLQKALIRRWQGPAVEAAIAAGVEALAAAFETDEPQRAMAAFQARRAERKRGG